MDHGIELRTPFVDVRLLDDIAPVLGGLRRFPGKVLISSAPRAPLPRAVTRRVKTGFGIPVAAWVAKGSSQWAAEVAKLSSAAAT
jgi:asparagine synthase (glutamine-hydrolysing)